MTLLFPFYLQFWLQLWDCIPFMSRDIYNSEKQTPSTGDLLQELNKVNLVLDLVVSYFLS